MICNQSLVDLDTPGIVSHIELSVYENKVRRRLHLPLTSPFFVSDTFDLFNVTYKRDNRMVFNSFLNGTKNGDIGSTCKRGLIARRNRRVCVLGCGCHDHQFPVNSRSAINSTVQKRNQPVEQVMTM